jgi:hypothetical protein
LRSQIFSRESRVAELFAGSYVRNDVGLFEVEEKDAWEYWIYLVVFFDKELPISWIKLRGKMDVSVSPEAAL